jgi:peptidoglycan/xylan/chitin deacetylase (PgdA/CDA1 family)
LVEEHLAAQTRHGGAVVVGRIDLAPAAAGDWYSRRAAEVRRAHYDRLRDGVKGPGWDACYGGNMSAPRAHLLAAGCFDEDLWPGADVELGYRLAQRGLPIVYMDAARVVHDDLKPLRRQTLEIERRGRMFVRLGDLHPPTRRTLLGGFGAGTPREPALRRIAIAARLSPRTLAALHPLARVAGREEVLWHAVHRLSLWRGVRSATSRAEWRRMTRGVPVLTYHAFTRPGEPASRYVVSPRSLRRHVWLLRVLRRRVVPLQRLVDALASGEPPPDRAVAITIDDGYRDALEVAAPILAAPRLPFTVFAVSGRLGSGADWAEEGPLAGRPLLDVGGLRALERFGGAIGAHTRRHPDLTAVPEAEAREEIAGSRRDLEEVLGHPVDIFSHPFGRMNEATRAIVGTCFRAAVSVRPGTNGLGTPLDALNRLDIRGTDGLITVARAAIGVPVRRTG